MEMLFNIMKIKDFAKQIGIPESTVRTWRRRGEIPEQCFFIIGSTVFVKVEEVRKWISQVA